MNLGERLSVEGRGALLFFWSPPSIDFCGKSAHALRVIFGEVFFFVRILDDEVEFGLCIELAK